MTDRWTIGLASTAVFLTVLALLAGQLRTAPSHARRQTVVMRRVYETHVVEVIASARSASGPATSSVVTSSAAPVTAAPVASTRTS